MYKHFLFITLLPTLAFSQYVPPFSSTNLVHIYRQEIHRLKREKEILGQDTGVPDMRGTVRALCETRLITLLGDELPEGNPVILLPMALALKDKYPGNDLKTSWISELHKLEKEGCISTRTQFDNSNKSVCFTFTPLRTPPENYIMMSLLTPALQEYIFTSITPTAQRMSNDSYDTLIIRVPYTSFRDQEVECYKHYCLHHFQQRMAAGSFCHSATQQQKGYVSYTYKKAAQSN